MNEIQKLIELAKKAADTIQKYGFVRLVSHNDADGLTSAAIMCQALLRKNIRFQLTITGRLDESVIEEVNRSTALGDLAIFCDMGSGQPDLIAKLKPDSLIIDHHQPVGESQAKVSVNPHLAGIDGATALSASGTSYFVARELGPENLDLAGLAIAGAVGDKQLFFSGNAFLLEEAMQAGVVSIRKGLKVGDGDLADVLEYTTEPFLDISGDRKKVEEFLAGLGISGDFAALPEAGLKKLINAIALKLAKQASPEAVEAVIGDIYILSLELVPNVYDFVSVMNTCGKLEKYGLAIAFCLKDPQVAKEAIEITREHQKNLALDIKQNVEKIQKGENLWYLHTVDALSTGTLASAVVRYVHPELPFISVNETEEIVKVSARGTRELVSRGLDLAFAMREAAGAVGGSGGGHNVASGASIPRESIEEFLRIADSIIGQQLHKNKTKA